LAADHALPFHNSANPNVPVALALALALTLMPTAAQLRGEEQDTSSRTPRPRPVGTAAFCSVNALPFHVASVRLSLSVLVRDTDRPPSGSAARGVSVLPFQVQAAGWVFCALHTFHKA
jgi:hypothetical protein